MKIKGKNILSALLILSLCLTLCACGDSKETTDGGKTYKVGICNYVSDASLDQIVANIRQRLEESAEQNGISIEILEQNANADASLMEQIISNFIAEDVDLMVGVATPVAVRMQALTEDTDIPVVFAAVSDPVGAGLVESMEKPGANVTGSSDALNTTAVMDLIFAANPDCAQVALLYDLGQDSSTAAIAEAKKLLEERGVAYADYTGTTTDELMLAVDALIADGAEAVFTPTDNTVMTAELAIYEKLAQAGIPHFAGADSFALNGAFVGYGVDYAALGRSTADMVFTLLQGGNAAETAVCTFDNGLATVNTETCEALGLDYETVKSAFEPYCTAVQSITTAESFD